MTTHQRCRAALRPVVLVLLGLSLIATYRVLAHFHVGSFGSPADIGGGVLPLAGLLLLAAGVVDGLVVLGRRLYRRF